ncbi:MAG: L,D-transpeptidase [Lachnospiraceae bacterium]|nr:L,D-transpeptidase [Lachnospiraceae bacterium]
MMTKSRKFILYSAGAALLAAAALCALGYVLLLGHYARTFPYGTWINGVYCTGLTVDQVNSLLCQQEYDATLSIMDDEGNEYELDCNEYVTGIDYTLSVQAVKAQARTDSSFSQTSYSVNPVVTVDEEAFGEWLFTVSPFSDIDDKYENKVTLQYTEDGYVLSDTGEEMLDFDRACEVLLSAVQTGVKSVSLTETDCYTTEAYTSDDKYLLDIYSQIEKYTQNHQITFEADEGEYAMTEAEIQGVLAAGEDGIPLLNKDGVIYCDTEKVEAYVAALASDTSTRNHSWEFVTHSGETVEVVKGNYGRVMENESELAVELIEALRAESFRGTLALEYTYYPSGAVDNDYGRAISETYIEVSISEQHCYMYQGDELIWESDCVTGDVSKGRDTPKGVYYIEYKQQGRTLRGADYTTYVYYWMHFYDGCGFHDAYWKSSFGGTVYLTNGSHGCVNLPSAKAKELYSLVESGMTVIVY